MQMRGICTSSFDIFTDRWQFNKNNVTQTSRSMLGYRNCCGGRITIKRDPFMLLSISLCYNRAFVPQPRSTVKRNRRRVIRTNDEPRRIQVKKRQPCSKHRSRCARRSPKCTGSGASEGREHRDPAQTPRNTGYF
jgi:hypothetical protein